LTKNDQYFDIFELQDILKRPIKCCWCGVTFYAPELFNACLACKPLEFMVRNNPEAAERILNAVKTGKLSRITKPIKKLTNNGGLMP
jgi:hypothetical protein